MVELKPCPFCGCRDICIRETPIGNYQNIFYIAICHDCGAKTNYFRLAVEAKAAWNRRAEQ